MESIGTLAGGIAHDFNNILMGIQGNASLMLLKTKSNHPSHEKLKNIETYVENGTELTRQLLGFARRGKYYAIATDLNDVIDKSSSMFGRTKKEIRIHADLQQDIWTVEVDRGQIEQALLNLYVNAWQAMPGGGDLYLKTENVILDTHFKINKPYSGHRLGAGVCLWDYQKPRRLYKRLQRNGYRHHLYHLFAGFRKRSAARKERARFYPFQGYRDCFVD
jgi:nitrogen-specific signal transduction histidine kinase